MRYFYIAIFGLLGVFLRFGVGVWAARLASVDFPVSTFLVNIVGSFFIGFVYVFAFEHFGMSESLRVGLMVGFFGGFTTFSSFSLETVRLLETGKVFLGLAYVVLSPILCVVFSYLGLLLGRGWVR